MLAIPAAAAARVLELPGASALLDGVPLRAAGARQRSRSRSPRAPSAGTGSASSSPSRERLPLLGCLFPSNLFPDRAPRGALLLSVFAAPALHGASDAALARELAPALKHLLGAAREPVLLDVARYPEGIPLYDVEHRARTRALRERLARRARSDPVRCRLRRRGVRGGRDVGSHGRTRSPLI